MIETGAEYVYGKAVTEKKQGETPIYRHIDLVGDLEWTPYLEVQNMQDFFKKVVHDFGNNKFLGTLNKEKKVYEWKTYQEVNKLSIELGSSILSNNLFYNTSGEGLNTNINLFGVYSKNREEWIMLEVAGYYYNFSIVPLYDTLGADSMMYIVNQTNMNTIYISGENVSKILKLANTYQIKNIICFDKLSEELEVKVKERHFNLIYLHALMEEFKDKSPLPFVKIDKKDIYQFCYTSGTTGNPKGVIHYHQNALAFLATCKRSIGVYKTRETDVHYSYLPLPHIYEKQIFLSLVLHGASLGFYGGDITKMTEDLQILQPTLFCSVPRIFNRYYSKIKEGFDAAPPEKKAIIDLAFKEKLANIHERPDIVHHEKWDELVFKDIRKLLGGKVRAFVTGGAALSGEICEFLKVCFSCCFFEGYGQTESFGGCFQNAPFDGKYGDVGGVNSSVEFKLIDIPEMGYSADDLDANGNPIPRGEICIRGQQVCGGYYKDPERTKQAIDEEGWLHTGDVGQLNSDLSLKIIDRKGNLFKLAQGEFVAPEKIENIYSRAKGVVEAYVYGEALRSYLVALVIIDSEYVILYAKQNNIPGDLTELCNNKEIRDHIFQNIIEEGKKANLNGFEQVRGIKLDPKPLVLHSVTTNTLKIKRPDAKKKFKDILTEVYNEVELTDQVA
ncbi:hypothetical protein ABPG72_013158 [Tetrahymena utriculariae]